MRSFHQPGRSLVYGANGMVATSHATASVVGLDILKAGGNAVDAAIAMAATLGIVEPGMTGIGGDCFALIWKPAGGPQLAKGAPQGGAKVAKGSNSGKLIALNASGRAPMAATTDWYAKKGIKSIELQSPHAVTVPGAVDGWSMLLKDHGTMTFAQVLGPAIELAEKGTPVTPRVAYDWAKLEAKLNVHAGARQHLLKDGRIPREREIMAYPALAKTLRTIAKDGRDAFYKGAVAEDIVASLKELGGLHTMADFEAQMTSASYVEPISIRYGDLDVCELPPSNQGITALIMLNMLKRIPAYRDTHALSATRYHILMEAARLAFAVRDTYVADPQAARVPIDDMLSDAFADQLAKRIDPKRMTPDLGPVPRTGGSDTVYFSVADKDGMMVSFINSLFKNFGTGIVGPKSGVTLHNRGQGFELDPKHPSAIAPGKRPMHTLVPAFTMKDGKPDMAFGVMGANFQPMGHVCVVTNMVDHGLDPQEALDGPRMFYEDGELGVETAMPAHVLEGLAQLGHKPVIKADPWGGGQIVQRDPVHGLYVGASDPRKDGCALGY